MHNNPFELNLPKTPANHQPLTPLCFLARTAAIYPDHPAVVHGKLSRTYSELYARCRRLASALARRYVGVGDTVTVAGEGASYRSRPWAG